jgi:flagellar motility protein MotE (MotC chaperone)
MLLSVLIIGKLIVGSIFFYRIGIGSLFMESNAVASELKNEQKQIEKEYKNNAGPDEIDLNILAKRKAELDAEQERLTKKKADLVAIEEEINKKIETLNRLRMEIRAEVAREKAFEEQKLKHLIKVYSAMKPQSAAELIEKLDLTLAIELLSKMKGDAVGNILSYINIQKAAKISEGLVK